MEKSILDVSVIIKWFVQEEDSDKALVFLNSLKNNKVNIIVPTLLFYELGNVLISKNISVDIVGEIIAMLQNLSLEIQDIGLASFRKIYQNSVEYSITFYDAAYITLLQKEDCLFITADRKLFQKVNKVFLGAKLLSDLGLPS